jgi:hypothetical protein
MIDAAAPPLIVFDASRRTYVGLSRDGSYWHVVRPTTRDDRGVRAIEEPGRPTTYDPPLVCSCPARKPCYRVAEAIAYEARGEGARPMTVLPGQTGLFEEPQP